MSEQSPKGEHSTIAQLEAKLAKIQAVVNEQAKDPGLWSVPVGRPQYIAEAHLQQELRRLHAIIEDDNVLSPARSNILAGRK